MKSVTKRCSICRYTLVDTLCYSVIRRFHRKSYDVFVFLHLQHIPVNDRAASTCTTNIADIIITQVSDLVEANSSEEKKDIVRCGHIFTPDVVENH